MTRRASLTGISTDAPGFRGVRNTRHIHEIRLPSGSLPVSQLEPLDLPKAHFNEALLLALALNFLCWFGFALIIRALFF